MMRLSILLLFLAGLVSIPVRADTLEVYKMGYVKKIGGLWYGSEHTLILHTDSSFIYRVKVGNQISTSQGVENTGTWTRSNDTLNLQGSTGVEINMFNSGYRETRANMMFWIQYGECISCLHACSLIVHSRGKSIIDVLVPEVAPLDRSEKPKHPVPYLSNHLVVDVALADSITFCGQTLHLGEKKYNEINIQYTPAFSVQLVKHHNQWIVLGTIESRPYVFRRTE